MKKPARQGGALRRPAAGEHLSKVRTVDYHYWPNPEVRCRPVEKALNAALRAGTIYQWWTSRTGQSWYFAGAPGAAMRVLRLEVFELLGGKGHVREWRELPDCKHSDCWTDCRKG